MNLQPILQNDFIILEPLREYNYEPLYQFAKDPLIREQHLCMDRCKLEKFSEYFGWSRNSKRALIVIDKSRDSIIGKSRFKRVENAETAIEIGCHSFREVIGKKIKQIS